MVYTVRNKIFPSNTYIIATESRKDCLLIDPGLDVEAVEERLEQLQLKPATILATHGHFDHVGSIGFFQKKYSAKFYIHELDVKILKSINFFLKIMKIDKKVDVPIPDFVFKGASENLQLEQGSVGVYNFAGHTDGSCLFKMGVNLFSGDTLYSKGTGVNPFPGQDKAKLKTSLLKIVDLFSDDILVYPGHGQAETLGKIKKENKELTLFLEPS